MAQGFEAIDANTLGGWTKIIGDGATVVYNSNALLQGRKAIETSGGTSGQDTGTFIAFNSIGGVGTNGVGDVEIYIEGMTSDSDYQFLSCGFCNKLETNHGVVAGVRERDIVRNII